MKVREAYKNYYQYCKDSETWTWDFIKDNLKKSWIDYEEYNFEEFKNKILTDDKFNERWANGCTRELSLEERVNLFSKNVNGEHLMKYADNDGLDVWNEILNKHNIPTRTIID
jgi:hypothetical protein